MLDDTPRLRPIVESMIEDFHHIQWEVTRSKWLGAHDVGETPPWKQPAYQETEATHYQAA